MNLPYSVTWRELKDLFRSAGPIVRADVQQTPDGRSRGNGIVTYETVDDAQRAVDKYHGYDWMGRRIEIREDRYAGESRDRPQRGDRDVQDRPARGGMEPRPRNSFTDDAVPNGEANPTIYVANLPWATTNEDLLELFTTVGQVDRAEIAYDGTGRPSGNAVVQLATTDLATVTIQKLDGYVYGQRPLAISYAQYNGTAPTAPGQLARIPATNEQQQQQQAGADVSGAAQVEDPVMPPIPADTDEIDVPMPNV